MTEEVEAVLDDLRLRSHAQTYRALQLLEDALDIGDPLKGEALQEDFVNDAGFLLHHLREAVVEHLVCVVD